MFTDHWNLLFVFQRTSIEKSLGRLKVLNVIRWALYLSTFTYRIEHVPGDKNVMVDIITRWMRGYRRIRPTVRCITAPVPAAPTASELQWPSRKSILDAQEETDHEPNGALKDTDGLLRINDATWIPPTADELKLKLLTVSHAGSVGHREIEATRGIIAENFSGIHGMPYIVMHKTSSLFAYFACSINQGKHSTVTSENIACNKSK